MHYSPAVHRIGGLLTATSLLLIHHMSVEVAFRWSSLHNKTKPSINWKLFICVIALLYIFVDFFVFPHESLLSVFVNNEGSKFKPFYFLSRDHPLANTSTI